MKDLCSLAAVFSNQETWRGLEKTCQDILLGTTSCLFPDQILVLLKKNSFCQDPEFLSQFPFTPSGKTSFSNFVLVGILVSGFQGLWGEDLQANTSLLLWFFLFSSELWKFEICELVPEVLLSFSLEKCKTKYNIWMKNLRIRHHLWMLHCKDSWKMCLLAVEYLSQLTFWAVPPCIHFSRFPSRPKNCVDKLNESPSKTFIFFWKTELHCKNTSHRFVPSPKSTFHSEISFQETYKTIWSNQREKTFPILEILVHVSKILPSCAKLHFSICSHDSRRRAVYIPLQVFSPTFN